MLLQGSMGHDDSYLHAIISKQKPFIHSFLVVRNSSVLLYLVPRKEYLMMLPCNHCTANLLHFHSHYPVEEGKCKL